MPNHKITALLAMLAMVISPAAYAAKPGKIKPHKIDVCHVPKATPDNLHIINISTNGNALNTHLSHGDWEATAEMCDAIPDNDCDGEPDPVADDADCVAINGGSGWTCQIGICNSPPTDIALESADIDENLKSGTPVGMLSSTDPDSPGPFTYTFVAGDGDSDNASFSISGSQLLSSATFDFESKNSYSIRLMTDAGDGGTYQEAITISVNDINEAPTAIVLENDSIHENQATGTLISYFTTTDVDAGDSHVYTLVAGLGDTDNASFDIVDDQLVSAESFDFETRNSYSVRAQSEDSGGLTITQSYSITIIDVNDPPTSIALDNSDVDEEQAVGTVVGTFTSTDVDSAGFEYSLVAGFGDADNASFSIVGDQLQSTVIFDYGVQNSFNIRVQTDDGDGGTFQDTFTITIISICGGDCFPNGVAAGDVETTNGQSSVVLWARASYTGTVRFEYGRDPDFVMTPDGIEDVEVVTETNEDGTIYYIPSKVPVTELLAGTQYYYRACRDSCPPDLEQGIEARGSFRTPHSEGKHGLRFGVSSCWRGDMKPFVSMNNVPERNLDFFVALGDTIYADSRASGGLARILPEFRNKYNHAFSQLNTPMKNLELTGLPVDDNYFALARASTAFFADIDDHEVVNDWIGGAPPSSQTDTKSCNREILGIAPDGICFCDPPNDQNPYNPGDAEYDPDWVPNCERPYINETDLYKAALKAWHEYNPIREEKYGATGDDRTANKSKLYRHRTFGKDAAMFMLDTRTFRDEGATLNPFAQITMLGKVQLEDLKKDLQEAENNGITWKFVMVPEPIQNLGLAGAGDRFESYDYERGIILDFIETEGIANVVFISGDIHANIVNNLTYRVLPLFLQRFSTAWEISTGPVAYSGSGSSFQPAGPTGTRITFGGEGESHEPLDVIFKTFMDGQLWIQQHPWTGLGFEDFLLAPPLQQLNRFVPSDLLQGSYVAGHSYGWTEFEINATTQKLLVTTYGIDWYDAPAEDEYTDDKLSDLLTRKPYILQQFEVLPRNGRPRCGDDICAPFTEKCGGNDDTLLQCTSDCGKCGNGELCGDDNMCASGLCSGDIAGVCISPQANGQPCTRDEGCQSGNCRAGIPTPTCQATSPGGSTCSSHTQCSSGVCSFGFCKAVECSKTGTSCTRDWQCCSQSLNACSGIVGSQDCK
jgi:phosphodiesterase/alkaline phosphatase D-like protein